MGDATLGAQFATALAAKDFDGIRGLLAPDISFRGVTPSKAWEAEDSETFISDVLMPWFGEDDIVAVERLETDSFSDCDRVGYRFRVREDDEEFLVEQQAFLRHQDGRINWMRVACSGFRPA